MTRLAFSLALAGPFATAPNWVRAQATLGSAMQDERDPEALYAAVLARFDGVKPFANSIPAGHRRKAMLTGLYTTHGAAVPENGCNTGPQAAHLAPETLADACKTGVSAEIANRDLYDVTVLPAVSADPDFPRVMQRLRDASQNNHLPVSHHCVDRTRSHPAPKNADKPSGDC